jgi:hypothetical protein
MDGIHRILNNLNNSLSAQKTYDGKKRNDLKDSDFLFPETRSFPIVTPTDVKDAINNYGRMSGQISYETFLRKLYNKCKSKGPEFVAALPEASKEKLGIKKAKSYDNMVMSPDAEDEQETCDMVISALKNIVSNANAILNNSDMDRVKENLTEPWILGMIAVIEDNISTVHDFVKFSEQDADTNSAGEKKNRPGLWENIRKKKEREGKDYKPAKPGDKDRPDPSQWKKLTNGKTCAQCGLAMENCKCNVVLDIEEDDLEPTEDNTTPISE